MTPPDELALYRHDACLAHDPPSGEFETPWSGRLAVPEPHPDRPERLRNVRAALETELGDRLDVREAPRASRAALERVHDPEYLAAVREFAESGGGRLTPTTGGNEHTYKAATRAAGGALAAAGAALEGELAYALVRPSGHHAQPSTSDGFCFCNNAAVAAEAALERPGVDRVAVVDWDVHHANGTQECFYGREDVLVLSIHNDHGAWDPETHPQTGGLEERGTGAGEGYTVNVPTPPGTGNEGYATLLDRLVEPVLAAYGPDLVVGSAGGDAGTVDPLGRNLLTKAGFETIGRRLRGAAPALALVQEGGYQPSHLAYAMLGTVEGALGIETGVEDPMEWLPEDLDTVGPRLEEVVAAHAEYWPVE